MTIYFDGLDCFFSEEFLLRYLVGEYGEKTREFFELILSNCNNDAKIANILLPISMGWMDENAVPQDIHQYINILFECIEANAPIEDDPGSEYLTDLYQKFLNAYIDVPTILMRNFTMSNIKNAIPNEKDPKPETLGNLK